MSKEEVLSQALALSDAERTEVALRLLDSVDAPDPHEHLSDEELVEELEQRVRDVASGKVKTVPWSQLKKELEDELDDQ